MILNNSYASASIGVLSLCSFWIVDASGAEKPKSADSDWPGWRGANGDCVVSDTKTRIAVWGDAGPLKIWENPAIPAKILQRGVDGGSGSVVVSGDRVYVYATPTVTETLTTRTYSDKEFLKLGWSPVKLPDQLRASMEKARISPERAVLKPNEIGEWMKKTKEALLTTEDDRKKFDLIVNDRLQRGTNAVSLDILDKLATVTGRIFNAQAELDKWFDANKIDANVRKVVCDAIPTNKVRSDDTIYCLNAADGKIVWKRSYPGTWVDFGRSCTPCVADGRVYVLGEDCMLYCLNAKDGTNIWTNKPNSSWRNSSFQIIDGLAIVQDGALMAFDAATGKPAWSLPEAGAEMNTPTPWVKDGKTYLVCPRGAERVSCVDIRPTGKVLWSFPITSPGSPGNHGSVAVGGDHLVVFTGNKLFGYRMSLEKAEDLWKTDVSPDPGCSPVIYKNRVYLAEGGRTLCLNLEDGKILWDGKTDTDQFRQIVAADDKLVVAGRNSLLLLNAAPDKFELLAKASMPVTTYTTPAIVNGRMYIRLQNAIGCFDLSKSATTNAPAGK